MIAEKYLKEDKIFQLLRNACNEIFPNDSTKAQTILRKESKIRSQLMRLNDEKGKLIQSVFLSFNRQTYDLIDLIIFSAITNVRIQFRGEFSYLNSFIAYINSKTDEYFLFYDSDSLFDNFKKLTEFRAVEKKVPLNIEVISTEKILSRVKKHVILHMSKNGINPLPFFESVSFNESKFLYPHS